MKVIILFDDNSATIWQTGTEAINKVVKVMEKLHGDQRTSEKHITITREPIKP